MVVVVLPPKPQRIAQPQQRAQTKGRNCDASDVSTEAGHAPGGILDGNPSAMRLDDISTVPQLTHRPVVRCCDDKQCEHAIGEPA